MSKKTQWYLYANLHDASDVIVIGDDEVVAAIYTLVAGPFATEAEAAQELERRRKAA